MIPVKIKRSARTIIIVQELLNRPHHLFPLTYFADELGVAKSSLSEDIGLIKETIARLQLGIVETVAGAAGGVRFLPLIGAEKRAKLAKELCQRLQETERIIPGGFLYMNDIIYDPEIAGWIGQIFASRYVYQPPEYVLTVETKGIPLAMMTARALGVPLVIARDDSKVTEGSSVSINYVSGSTRRIQTMALARRSLPRQARVLIIDDFMKAGGTARGMKELLQEFEAEVVGTGVLIATVEPEQKLVGDYFSLLELVNIDEEKKQVEIRPAAWVTQPLAEEEGLWQL
ncbi:LacI family transcriptional regulator [Carboxydocella sp. JDF658]|nr:LacI family transcriptional regulator [Carboxydocella sp. ULO1]GAW32884.1 LacI family transcriptional regulator [Carboxydocella sp. JDF658]